MNEKDELQQLRDEIELSWEILGVHGFTKEQCRVYKSLPNAIGNFASRKNRQWEEMAERCLAALLKADEQRARWRLESEKLDPNQAGDAQCIS